MDQFNEALNNQLCTVEEALHCEIFRSIYLKVKIMVKDNNKPSIMYEETLNYKCDTLVTDKTANIKLGFLGRTL